MWQRVLQCVLNNGGTQGCFPGEMCVAVCVAVCAAAVRMEFAGCAGGYAARASVRSIDVHIYIYI